MELAVIGVTHQSASVEVRSVFAFTDSQKVEFIARLQDLGIAEAVILSTCNRSEIYFTGAEPQKLFPIVKKELVAFCGAEEEAAESLTMLWGRAAILRLFRVACGLESMVVGEDQILGQVKEAYDFAAKMGATGKILNKLFREAVTLAKRVKTELKISQVPLSISYIGVKALGEALKGIRGKKIVLVGLGKMNVLTMKYLQEEGAGLIWLCNRDQAKARAFAAAEGGESPETEQGNLARKKEKPGPGGTEIRLASFEDRYRILQEADAVVTATASPHTVFRPAELPPLTKPLIFLDIAVPPDVDKKVAQRPGVTVLDIDDLEKTAAENLSRRRKLAMQADLLAERASDEAQSWLLRSRVDPSIQSIHQKCRIITEDVTGYLFGKLHLTEREKRLVTKVVASGLQRLVREPVRKLKAAQDQGQQEEYIRIVEELFDLKE